MQQIVSRSLDMLALLTKISVFSFICLAHSSLSRAADNVRENQRAFELSQRIHAMIEAQLENAANLQALVLKESKTGRIDLTRFDALHHYLMPHKLAFRSIDYLYFATPQGGITTVGVSPDGVLQVMKTPENKPGNFDAYRVNSDGKPDGLLKQGSYFDPREREWFKCASQRYSGCWSKPYTGKLDELLGVSFASPIFTDEGKLLGVLGLDLILSQLSLDLKATEYKPGQHVWVLDNDGYLVASADGIDEVLAPDHPKGRLHLSELTSPIGRAVAGNLKQSRINLKKLTRASQLSLTFNSRDHIVTIQPFRPNMDISWLILAVTSN